MVNNQECEYMKLAFAEMLKSTTDTKVGCVIVKDNEVIAMGYKTKEEHAERMAIQSAIKNGKNIKNAILFTTLEPCIKMSENQQKESCCDLIIKNQIKTVFIGSYDPNPCVWRKGWKFLKNNNIIRKEFHEDITEKIKEENKKFEDYFLLSNGNEGTGKVNHKDNGSFEILTKDKSNKDISIKIKWTVCGKNIAYIYANFPMKAAHADGATDFDEITNSKMYIYSHSVGIPLNEIGIFSHKDYMILVKPTEIQSGPTRGDENYFVKFKYIVKWK